ncbi:G-type lectin S-receptor-like serine/threonine-protein kinase At4g27290 isoform X4 [Quercus robur]|nr:G-type lectin S-receptor-like serine/threonine-protein kinase At4g27290 isoform X4 [Quercus robur]
MEGFKIIFLFSLLLSLLGVPTALDTITPTLSIRDGESETIVSAGGSYELGIFSPGNSKSRYLGIWYKKISTTTRTIVWVANREVPLTDTSGVLTITHPRILALINGTSGIVWSSNTTRTTKSPVGQLLESGNLVVKDGNNENPDSFVWQSFDYPCDTFLPGMKFGRNLITGLDRFLSSWKSIYDPAPGEFTVRLDLHGFPQGFIIKGQTITNRIGPWDGAGFSGIPSGRTNPAKGYEFVMNDNEVYYKFSNPYGSTFARAVLNPSGVMQAYLWNDPNGWQFYLTMPIDQCDSYNLCGAYASCNIKRTPTCECLEGFIPKSPNNWNKLDRIEGCIRRIPLAYNNTDGFRKYTGLNLPDTFSSWYNKTMSLEDCEELCLKNFSCVAYTNSNSSGGGSGCLLWFGSLIDMRIITDSLQDLYIRVAASELDQIKKQMHSSEKKKAVIIASSVISVTGIVILALIMCILKKKVQKRGSRNRGCRMDNINEDGEEDLELPVFDLNLIVNATHNFSNDKKLGEGGFGPVYRGALMDGQEIAVKRLSKNSRQGVVEFKNEVQLIAKLQHRNLVKLLGFCIQGDEKMLIYEFMPNKSLDFFIFDKTRSKLLTWHMRMNIVGGIARGLLYLHQDSRLRIIHRDIKTSNILLDKDMNPKISDFGMARTFWGDQIEENTERIVGT